MNCFKKQVPSSSSTRGNDRAKEWKRKREPGPVKLEKRGRITGQDVRNRSRRVSETESYQQKGEEKREEGTKRPSAGAVSPRRRSRRRHAGQTAAFLGGR